jgi:hypothetical protein
MTLTRINITSLTLVAFLLSGLQPQAYAKDTAVPFARPALCTALLAGDSPSDHELTPTQSLIVYLTVLLNQKTIGREELNRFIRGLENQELINPISEEETVTPTALIHFKALQPHLDSENAIDRNELLAWARDTLSRLQQIQGERKEASSETKIPYRKIFYPVPAGSFKRRINGIHQTTILTHPFEAMETQVTQLHWAQVMGDNPSHFANGPQSIEIEINYRKFRINPDHPVEMISWWSALVFANELSKRHGLKPAYDLSGIEFEDGSLKGNRTMLAADEILRVAAKGSLNARYCFSAPKINAPEENIYDTEGYRFPTYAEQLYFLSNAGTANGKYYFGDDSKQLKNHAWYFEIAGGQTHPVGALLPMRIGTGVFYDVLGNVDEWAYDEEDEMSGANPIGRTLGFSSAN